MFGKKSARQQTALANQLQGQTNQAFTNASQPNPLQTALERQNLSILNWADGTSGPKDASAFPDQTGMSLYNNAVQHRNQDRAGIGILRLGAGSENPDYLAMLREQQANEQQERAAGDLENYVTGRVAAARGESVPLINLTQDRQMGLASLSSGNSNNAWSRALQAQQSSGFLNSNLFNQLMGGARTAVGAYGGVAAARAQNPYYKYGGDLTPRLGRRVVVGDGSGPELAVDDLGRAQVVGADGPEEMIPTRPAFVVPNAADAPSLSSFRPGAGEAPPALSALRLGLRPAPVVSNETLPMMRPPQLPDTMPRTTAALSFLDALKGPSASVPGTDAPLIPVSESSVPVTDSLLRRPALRPPSLSTNDKVIGSGTADDPQVLPPPRLRPLDGDAARELYANFAPPADLPLARPLDLSSLPPTARSPLSVPSLGAPLASNNPPRLRDTGDRRADLGNYANDLENYRNPANRNSRGKSALKSAGYRALDALTHGGGLMGALVGATEGGIQGAVAPNLDERIERDRELGRVYGQIQRGDELAKNQLGMDKARADINLTNTQAGYESQRAEAERTKAAQQQLLDVWDKLPTFDPSSPDADTQTMLQRARDLRVTLPKKERGDSFNTAVAPDGSIIVTNSHTGDYRVDRSNNVSKPRELKADDLPDTLFGLPDEKQITDEARAAVAPSMRNRQVTDFAARHYQKPDGTLDEAKAWQDIEDGVVKPGDIWENVTDRDEQRLAQARKGVRDRYASDRALVDDFRLRVTRNRPQPGATPASVAQVATRFNEIRRLPQGRARQTALKTFYDTLPYLDIR